MHMYFNDVVIKSETDAWDVTVISNIYPHLAA